MKTIKNYIQRKKKEERENQVSHILGRYGMGLNGPELIALYEGKELSQEEVARIAFKAGVELARNDHSVKRQLPDPKIGQLLRTLLLRLCWKPYEMNQEDRTYYEEHKERLNFLMMTVGFAGFGLSLWMAAGKLLKRGSRKVFSTTQD